MSCILSSPQSPIKSTLPKQKKEKKDRATMPPRYLNAGQGNDERPEDNKSRLFGRRRTIHQLFGGGKVAFIQFILIKNTTCEVRLAADILLWRNKHLSGAILAGVTVTWFLFEVVEYHFLTLLGQVLIAAMLLIFIWSNGAALLDRNQPKIPEIILSEKAFKEFSLAFHAKLSRSILFFQNVAMGRDLRLFLLAIASLWIISVVGSFCSSLNLLYFGYIAIQILPVLYERYEWEVDHLALKGSRDLKKLLHRFDSDFLNKIPRGPVKEKKYR
ncbi:Reticulon-like protein B2 [Platanthera guangdongensis]|uniref:Reticulon-like protein n=1 Tax=Platanthera guangdongensis TaxID=2320717 RepID=A0ABR2MYJ1_9ASPA